MDPNQQNVDTPGQVPAQPQPMADTPAAQPTQPTPQPPMAPIQPTESTMQTPAQPQTFGGPVMPTQPVPLQPVAAPATPYNYGAPYQQPMASSQFASAGNNRKKTRC